MEDCIPMRVWIIRISGYALRFNKRPGVFQHFMNALFRDFIGNFMVSYLDDFLSIRKPKPTISPTFDLFWEFYGKMDFLQKLKNVHFMFSEVNFLG